MPRFIAAILGLFALVGAVISLWFFTIVDTQHDFLSGLIPPGFLGALGLGLLAYAVSHDNGSAKTGLVTNRWAVPGHYEGAFNPANLPATGVCPNGVVIHNQRRWNEAFWRIEFRDGRGRTGTYVIETEDEFRCYPIGSYYPKNSPSFEERS